MEKRELVNRSMTAIVDAITACRIATEGKHEVVFLDGHFACRRFNVKNKAAEHMVYLLCVDINQGLPSDKWDIIRAAVRRLIERKVVK